MLSNPPQSGLQARVRQHRRQNSTPTAFETMKIANNPPKMHPQQQYPHHQLHGRARMSHRRGMSLDTRRQQMHSPATTRQDFLMVSDHTNTTGLASTPQHVLREAQQQRIARPGTHQQQAFANLASDENYLMSPHGTPHLQGYESICYDGLSGPSQQSPVALPFDMSSGAVAFMMKTKRESFPENVAVSSPDFELFPSSTMSTPTFVSFNESPSGAPGWTSEGETSSTRRTSRRVSNGIMDRVAKFETLGEDAPQRPLTPPHQNAPEYFPLTPMDTPHHRTIKQGSQIQRFTEDYDDSMEETLKPVRRGANQRPKTTFDEMRQTAEFQQAVPHPFSMAESCSQPDMAMAMTQGSCLETAQASGGMPLHQTPLDVLRRHSVDLSHGASPVTPIMGDFPGALDSKPDLQAPHMVQSLSGSGSSTTGQTSRRTSPHRRTESLASIVSAASIASIDIEQTRTTTGITLDDIHQFIDGPDPKDNKWVCAFEDCGKRFGRKENIKSHVQTHLNDRQYQCPTCNKCFVRQHDLKRHAKIHTGIKPYPCECGNSFARHDALTRHKQRGMCVGAFDGIVRKVVKRGRPRKHRPDMDERQDKSARTRKKNKDTSASSASSQSGYSDSSAVNSPENFDNDFDMIDNIMDVSLGGTTMFPSNLHDIGISSSAPVGPEGAEVEPSAHSPSTTSVHSLHSYVSQMSHMSLHPEPASETLPSGPASPAKSVASHYNEPPELSQSSSPPPCNKYFELEPTTSNAVDIMISSAADMAGIPTLAGLGNNEDDILLQYTHSDPNMLMLSSDSKFDDAFVDSTVDMFSHDNDMFTYGP